MQTQENATTKLTAFLKKFEDDIVPNIELEKVKANILSLE